jgi:sugar phosphate isomerase/epimerase
MLHQESMIPRREFVRSLAAVGLGVAAGLTSRTIDARAAEDAAPARIKLGIDNFALRAMAWKAPELIDYAASLRLDSLLISDLDAFASLDATYLAEVRSRAADAGVDLHVGTWSICPTSPAFRDKWGPAEEHLRLGIRVAQAVGSPVLRVVLGSGNDRLTPGGIQARIADTVAVLKACRGQALDAGVKIAVENHAGDMQAWELVSLIEAAGRDYVGANIDSGNATWALEDPLANLEVLGPYVLTSSLRDSAVWETERGAAVQWTAMGEGDLDLPAWFRRFAELCPQAPVHIETISGFNRDFPYLEPDFWKAWPDARAEDFARFLALAKRGRPREPHQLPDGPDRPAAEQAYQRAELERSIAYCRDTLELGVRRRQPL